MSWSASTSTPVSDGIRRRGAAIRGEWNVLLNPAHADFPKIKVGKAKPFEFDRRMFR